MRKTPNHDTRRRDFLAGASVLSVASIFGVKGHAAAAELETRRIRIPTAPGICLAPQLISEELLRLEGFSQIEYVQVNYDEFPSQAAMVAAGKADLTADAAITLTYLAEMGKPVVALSGVHAGCWELFGSAKVRAFRDLKGKRVAIFGMHSEDHLLFSSIAAYMGMDPHKHLTFVTIPEFDAQIKAFSNGEVDALIAYPPQPQKLRANRIGHVIIDSAVDRPWGQYFCCLVAANREFTERHPLATKAALRALLKASDLCAEEPERAARILAEKGLSPSAEIALEVLRKLPYKRWRESNPEDTLRFHALRLHEVGVIKSSPAKLIAQVSDWRFLNELKREMKA